MPPEDKYLQKVEEEINDICQWASFQKQTIVTAKSGVQNQISVLSRTARPRQTTDRLYNWNRRLQDIATLTFKVKHSLVTVNISDLFNLKNTQYNLRNSDFELPVNCQDLKLLGIQENVWDLSFGRSCQDTY